MSQFSPSDTFHAFRNIGDGPGRMMLMTTGSGIDEYFRATSKLKMSDDAAQFDEISASHSYIHEQAS